MTKIAYLECPTGMAGDMCLGAIVHAGMPLDYLIDQLNLLGLNQDYQLWSERVLRNGMEATKVHVDLLYKSDAGDLRALPESAETHTTFGKQPEPDHAAHADASPNHHHNHHEQAVRHLHDIEHIIKHASLPDRVVQWSLAIFKQLAIAEGMVHGIAPEQVHFHEVGATDAIVDIVGTCIGLHWLNIDQLYCSPMPVGGGTIRAAHGRLPVPAPAVLKLWELRQVPIYSNGIHRELVTPTGAAIATTLAIQFGAPPAMTLHTVGLGAGSQDLPIPNILRLWIGQAEQFTEQKVVSNPTSVPHQHHNHQSEFPLQPIHSNPSISETSSYEQDTIAVLETQIDDLNPQAIGYLFPALFDAGALDIFTQAIGMKKSRPGILLTVICPPDRVFHCETILFRETTTLGVRHQLQQRSILYREIKMLDTIYGPMPIKIARRAIDGEILNIQPEFEYVAKIAQQKNLPWQTVHQNILYQWQAQHSGVSQP